MPEVLKILSWEDAKARVLSSLGLPQNVRDLDIQLELLRAITWALTGGRTPVHVLRILNRTIEIAQELIAKPPGETEFLRGSLREALGLLAEVGDFAALDGGYWLPAPIRLVDVRRDDHFFLVGGLPTRLLPPAVQTSIVRSGPFRLIPRSGTLFLSLPTEDLSEWARIPIEPLDSWAQEILKLELPEYTISQEGSEVQLYQPERSLPGAPQFKRWFDRYEGVTGRFLARSYRIFGVRDYKIVDVDDGQLIRSGAILGPREVRRLMYAFDARCGNPTCAKWTSQSLGAELILNSVLPEPEHRILGALGRLELNQERVYERRWIFSSHIKQVTDILTDLSINIVGGKKVR